MVGPCLRYFTHIPMSEVERLSRLPGAAINEAKIVLAHECTRLLHGEEAANSAREAAAKLFQSGAAGGSGDAAGSEPQVTIAAAVFGDGMLVPDLLAAVGICASKGEARRLIQQGGISIGDHRVADVNEKVTKDAFAKSGNCLIKKGKKHYYRLTIS